MIYYNNTIAWIIYRYYAIYGHSNIQMSDFCVFNSLFLRFLRLYFKFDWPLYFHKKNIKHFFFVRKFVWNYVFHMESKWKRYWILKKSKRVMKKQKQKLSNGELDIDIWHIITAWAKFTELFIVFCFLPILNWIYQMN